MKHIGQVSTAKRFELKLEHVLSLITASSRLRYGVKKNLWDVLLLHHTHAFNPLTPLRLPS